MREYAYISRSNIILIKEIDSNRELPVSANDSFEIVGAPKKEFLNLLTSKARIEVIYEKAALVCTLSVLNVFLVV